MYEFSREPHWPGQWPSYNYSVVLRAFTTCATLFERICYCCFIYIMGIPDMVAVSFSPRSIRLNNPGSTACFVMSYLNQSAPF